MEMVFEEESSSLSSLMLENDVFLFAEWKREKRFFCFQIGMILLALCMFGFHLVLSTKEEIL